MAFECGAELDRIANVAFNNAEVRIVLWQEFAAKIQDIIDSHFVAAR